MNLKNPCSLLTLSFIVLANTSAFAMGSKVPGNGVFKDLQGVQSNRDILLRSEGRQQKLEPLGLPERVAFTQLGNGNTVMILRNDKGRNFSFQLPSSVYLGSMKQPYSLDRNNRLSVRGDVIDIQPGFNGSGQDLGLKLTLANKTSNSYSVDSTERCTITRTRQVPRTYCYRDRYGYRYCETHWVTETYYISGYREVTIHYINESSSFNIELFDERRTKQMQGRVNYAESSSRTSYRSACYIY
jgi:hypothetical protein